MSSFLFSNVSGSSIKVYPLLSSYQCNVSSPYIWKKNRGRVRKEMEVAMRYDIRLEVMMGENIDGEFFAP